MWSNGSSPVAVYGIYLVFIDLSTYLAYSHGIYPPKDATCLAVCRELAVILILQSTIARYLSLPLYPTAYLSLVLSSIRYPFGSLRRHICSFGFWLGHRVSARFFYHLSHRWARKTYANFEIFSYCCCCCCGLKKNNNNNVLLFLFPIQFRLRAQPWPRN